MAGTLVVAELADGKVQAHDAQRDHVRQATRRPLRHSRHRRGRGRRGEGARGVRRAEGHRGRRRGARPGLRGERFAPTVAAVAKAGGYDTVAVTASSFGKDLAPRLAAKLGAGYAPDINR